MKESRGRSIGSKPDFGDFQTPFWLARSACNLIRRLGMRPASIVEPTCGAGSFVLAALETFPEAVRVEAGDANAVHVASANALVRSEAASRQLAIRQEDFFGGTWPSVVAHLPAPILILGNPPWVTNAALGVLGSQNLPAKSNIDALRGIEALTGKSNFDISEWMLRESLGWLVHKTGTLAVLCKTSVARKVLEFAWRHSLPVESASIYRIDAGKAFAAAVDACFLVVRVGNAAASQECLDFPDLDAQAPIRAFGLRDGRLVADVSSYDRWASLRSDGLAGWRSGVKHDCSGVFELTPEPRGFRNAGGLLVKPESEFIFPLLKSSDLAHGREPRRWLLLSQREMGEDTESLVKKAPNVWEYLLLNASALDRRASSIYKKRPRFSIFGIGSYSFAPWKVAISGLYKSLSFKCVTPHEAKPVLFDDTCYFFACKTQEEAEALFSLLMSQPAQEYFHSLTFWDSKRPVTAALLNSLDLSALAKALGSESALSKSLWHRQLVECQSEAQQLLFRDRPARIKPRNAVQQANGADAPPA